jgi:hypothetical protein
LDGPLPKWCPAVALSRQDGRHSAVALLLKAALIQVSDYRLLGASGFLSWGDSWGKKSNEKTNICIDTCGVALSSGNVASIENYVEFENKCS